jgi:hypothetical protein
MGAGSRKGIRPADVPDRGHPRRPERGRGYDAARVARPPAAVDRARMRFPPRALPARARGPLHEPSARAACTSRLHVLTARDAWTCGLHMARRNSRLTRGARTGRSLAECLPARRALRMDPKRWGDSGPPQLLLVPNRYQHQHCGDNIAPLRKHCMSATQPLQRVMSGIASNQLHVRLIPHLATACGSGPWPETSHCSINVPGTPDRERWVPAEAHWMCASAGVPHSSRSKAVQKHRPQGLWAPQKTR